MEATKQPHNSAELIGVGIAIGDEGANMTEESETGESHELLIREIVAVRASANANTSEETAEETKAEQIPSAAAPPGGAREASHRGPTLAESLKATENVALSKGIVRPQTESSATLESLKATENVALSKGTLRRCSDGPRGTTSAARAEGNELRLSNNISLPEALPSLDEAETEPSGGPVPGAHPVGGIPISSRVSRLLASVRRPSDANDTSPSDGSNEEDDLVEVAGLVEAEPIMDDSNRNFLVQDLSHAQEVTSEALSRKRQLERQRRWRSVGGAVLLPVLVLVVLVLALTMMPRQGAAPTSDEETSFPSIPSPTAMPSTAPTSILEAFLDTLPTDTVARILDDPTSAQAKSFGWLMDYPGLAMLPAWRKTQLFALVAFFYAFEGPFWPERIAQDWLDVDKHECYWYHDGYGTFAMLGEGGLLVDLPEDVEYLEDGSPHDYFNDTSCNENMEITSIAFTLLKLGDYNPYLPPEIALLNSLTSILLDANQASHDGPRRFVPTEIGLLTNLEFFRMWDNRLDGTIPTQFGLLTKLSILDFDSNRFTGSIPTQFFALPRLEDLWLNNNDLSGPIPSRLGTLPSLKLLELSSNSFSGTLPGQLGDLEKLKELGISDNLLSWTVPPAVLQAPMLQVAFLSHNQLTGRIPTEIGRAASLLTLSLSGNEFTGPIPSEIGLLTNAAQLEFDNNFLSSSLPKSVGKMTSLRSLDLANNALMTGSLPLAELADLALSSELRHLNLSASAYLTGTIPEELCGLNQNASSCEYEYVWAVGMHMISNVTCSMEFDCTNNLCGCGCLCGDNATEPED